MQIEIDGAVVFDVSAQRHRFISEWDASLFANGRYIDKYTNWVFVCEHTVRVAPEASTRIGPQLAALDAKEIELTEKYQAEKAAIQARRRGILGIEHQGA